MENLVTIHRPLTKLYNTNVTASSITAPIPTITAPVVDGTTGFIDWRHHDGFVGNFLCLMFYGVGSSTNTATARVNTWRQVTNSIGALWIPSPVLALNLTHGTQVGIATYGVLDTENFVSTITASTAFTTANEIISPGADATVAIVKVDCYGADRVQVQLAKGNDTSINCLWGQF